MTKRVPRLRAVAGALAALVLVPSCGLPDGGSVTRVDDDEVPYGLLESATAPPGTRDDEVPGLVPVVFWLGANDRLAPERVVVSCAEGPEAVVAHLLDDLAAGPTEEARAAGRSTALPPESRLALAAVNGDTAEVEVDPHTSISPDRLPGAVGQIVLTVTSAPGIRAVALVHDGAPVQVPLPGGALTGDPVTADDYAALVPDRYREAVGCPQS